MRTITRTNARRPVAIAIGLGVAVVLGGCTSPTRTSAVRRAADIAIAMQIGPPLPDAIDTRTVWSAANEVPYSHVADVTAIDDWYDALPDRFGCHPEKVDLTDARWSLRCSVDEGDYRLVITARTSIGGDVALTTVGAHHEPAITGRPARDRPPANVRRR